MQGREFFDDLRALGAVRAPRNVLEEVLDQVGLGDHFAALDTALGPVFVAWNRVGVSAVMKTGTAAEFGARFRARFGREPRLVADLPAEIGTRFDLRSVTEFERAVLLKAREIPRGEVRTYGWIAAQIGHPAAVRAVGTALRKNPVPVLIPCHRVVRSDGHIGDYALGGSEAKLMILQSEGLGRGQIAQLVRAGRSAPPSQLAANG
ncbi:MAG TPA: MGMT family protein [Chloroflexota bacterium]|jgi:methylated-DNA-[protein]-cysteine S-methyltransferase|nr:MGMT family protein [Chloroflexota bacterium]